ncbi:DUF1612 domain-containing protein [Rhizobium pusense]|nr:DUF1612 domain-containing protein [Agrobacterium pusense]
MSFTMLLRGTAASILRQAGITIGAHLAAINLGLRTIAVVRRRHRDSETRLLAIAHGFLAAADIGRKEHDRLTLAKAMMDRKLEGRRASSKLPELVELVMAKPLVSAGVVAKTLDVAPQAARRIVLEVGLREITGRGRFRAWGILQRRNDLSRRTVEITAGINRSHTVCPFATVCLPANYSTDNPVREKTFSLNSLA